MLKIRVITALTLLAVLSLVLYLNSYSLFSFTAAAFLAAATWESMRLFGVKPPIFGAALWTVAFLVISFVGGQRATAFQPVLLLGAGTAIWLLRLTPSLAVGLPPLGTVRNRVLNFFYGIGVLACFVAIVVLFQHSALYLFSVMAIVWVADIGAYFTGRAFGKRKLAPSISPGKSWEGVIGGWGAVLLLAAGTTAMPALRDTFTARLQAVWGWGGFIPALTLIVAASVVGDLFESQLKRRIGMKDSSNLLPGHGGVLDRIDALIPVLPLAVLMNYWL
ncbi:MAG: phosphatidate cytidylyltransferase [Burkholderiaceae bacterium]|nr:phosphatidate cytidylyltransferase [Burkholderiaceae bacterium]